MKFSVAVYAPPFSSQTAYSAYRFVRATVERGHTIERVFFYHEGVHNGTLLSTVPQDEFDLCAAWRELKQTHSIDLIVCVAAALRRGILDASEARRHQRPTSNLPPEFELSGLGQLIDAAVSCDRHITFGA